MAEDRLVEALLSGKPYFGLGLRALQGLPERHRYLPAFLRKAVEHRPAGNVRILEVGSWAGASAVTWARSLQALQRRGEVVCVDTWAPYLDLEINTGDVYAEMNRIARLGLAKQLFDHNINTTGVSDLIKVRIGYSEDVLPRMAKRSFDLIYIDGNHDYKNVRSDLINAKRLVRERGVICGDDLEATLEEIDPGLLDAYTQKALDFIELPELGRSFHPGVTRAVGEILGQVSCYEGAWAAIWDGHTVQPVELDGGVLPMPTHIAAELSLIRPPDTPEAAGGTKSPPLDIFSHAPSQANGVYSGDPRLGPSRTNPSHTGAGASARAAMGPALIEQGMAGHNLVRYAGRFFALPQSRGPMDLRTLAEAELLELPNDTDLSRLRSRILQTADDPPLGFDEGAAAATSNGRYPGVMERRSRDITDHRPEEGPATTEEPRLSNQRLGALATALDANAQILHDLRQVLDSKASADDATQDELRARTAALDEQMARLQAALDEQAARSKAALDEQMAHSQAALDGRAAHLQAALDEQVVHLQAALAERDRSIGAIAEESAQLRAALAERTDARDAAVDEAATWHDQRLGALGETLAELGREMRAALSASAERASTLESRINRHDERAAAVEDAAAQRGQQLGDLDSAIAEAGRNLAGLAQGVSAHEFRSASMERDVASQDERLAAVEREAADWRARLQRMAVLDRDMALQGERLNAIESETRRRSAEATRLDDEIERLTAAIAEVASEEALEAALAPRDARLQSLEGALSEARAAADKLKDTVSSRIFRGTAVERDLAVQSERLANVEEAAGRWLKQMSQFPPSLDLLPRMSRMDFVRGFGGSVSVEASAPVGHFLFGPYLTIEPGVFILEVTCRATAIRDRAKPILSVEVAAGQLVIGKQALLAEALKRPVRIAFEIPEAVRDQGAEIEFRFSHQGNADIEIAGARLHLAGMDHPAAARGILGHRSWWPFHRSRRK